MPNTLLIGKDLPSCLEMAEALSASGRKVFTPAKSSTELTKFESENIFACTWNKSSAVSTHAMLINAETTLQNIDEVIFYFDSNYFCTQFETDRTEEISAGTDTMFTSFLFASNELIKRMDQKQGKILVSFFVKEYPSKAEIAASKTAGTVPAASIISAAQAGFASIAEDFASLTESRSFLSVLLAKCPYSNELYKSEKLLADWLASSMDSIHNAKNHQNVKQALCWNKADSKVQTGFSLFK